VDLLNLRGWTMSKVSINDNPSAYSCGAERSIAGNTTQQVGTITHHHVRIYMIRPVVDYSVEMLKYG